jgi:hypothetical protein
MARLADVMSTHTSTKKGRDFRRVVTEEYESLVRFAELLKLRSLSLSTQADVARQRGDGHAAGVARNVVKGGRRGCPPHAGGDGHNTCVTCANWAGG